MGTLMEKGVQKAVETVSSRGQTNYRAAVGKKSYGTIKFAAPKTLGEDQTDTTSS